MIRRDLEGLLRAAYSTRGDPEITHLLKDPKADGTKIATLCGLRFPRVAVVYRDNERARVCLKCAS